MMAGITTDLQMRETIQGESAVERFTESAMVDTPMELDEQAARRVRRRFRLLLDGGSLALFAIFLLRLVPVLLASKPLDPVWQGQFVNQMVSLGLLPFLGFVLLHFAVFIQPSHDRLRRRLRLVRHLAVLAVLGYLLLIPLQISSSLTGLSAAQAKKLQVQDQSARLSEIREALQQSLSLQDMNVRLQSLLQPALTVDQLNQKLPELRETLLQENEQKQKELSTQLMNNAEDLDQMGNVISHIGSALGWALAFASGAVPWGHSTTLFERLRRR